MPPPPPPPIDHAHVALMDQLDVFQIDKPFRNPGWKPTGRRNKSVKQIIVEAARKEAALAAGVAVAGTVAGTGTGTAAQSIANSGINTPNLRAGDGEVGGEAGFNGGPGGDGTSLHGDSKLAEAARNLSVYVNGNGATNGATGPTATFTNIESAPSLHPSSQRHYCDITGLPAPYTDPKTRLRYHNGEVFNVVRNLPPGAAEAYLAARGAQTVLK